MNEDIMNEGIAIVREKRFSAKIGIAMLIGSGLTAAAIVGSKKLKKALSNRKADRESEDVVVDADFEEVDIKPEDMSV